MDLGRKLARLGREAVQPLKLPLVGPDQIVLTVG
jgi:hypothetical protein